MCTICFSQTESITHEFGLTDTIGEELLQKFGMNRKITFLIHGFGDDFQSAKGEHILPNFERYLIRWF